MLSLKFQQLKGKYAKLVLSGRVNIYRLFGKSFSSGENNDYIAVLVNLSLI
ncbi:hypothetical protein PESP_a3473 [Pseudoalteromonas espejiana DSM 9414]|nr:hypothetical protein PESP_a3473 [Pseudoalteromonas espejiana DSM 9414]